MSHLKSLVPRLLALVCLILLPGCAIVETKVTRFHRLPPHGSGETFVIQEPKGASPLELGIYDAKIAAELQKYGWRQGEARSAQYVVTYDYSVGPPQTFTGALPVMGQTGGGTTYHSGTVSAYGSGGSAYGSYSGTSYTPATYGVVGTVPFSQTGYDRFFNITAKDRSGRDAFQMRCVSLGTLNEISRVLPHMIDSAFSEFPGTSGRTGTYHRVRTN
jgi:hypothetical protein